jgi:hypothetical protein
MNKFKIKNVMPLLLLLALFLSSCEAIGAIFKAGVWVGIIIIVIIIVIIAWIIRKVSNK